MQSGDKSFKKSPKLTPLRSFRLTEVRQQPTRYVRTVRAVAPPPEAQCVDKDTDSKMGSPKPGAVPGADVPRFPVSTSATVDNASTPFWPQPLSHHSVETIAQPRRAVLTTLSRVTSGALCAPHHGQENASGTTENILRIWKVFCIEM